MDINSGYYDMDVVRQIIEVEKLLIIQAMNDQVIAAHTDRLTIQQLAQKHTVDNETTAFADEISKMVHNKLFKEVSEFIKTDAKPLAKTLKQMRRNAGGPNIVQQFIASFVWAVTFTTVEILEEQHPNSLLDVAFWN